MKRAFIIFLLLTAAQGFLSENRVYAADTVDKVVAVVGDEIILLSELQKQIQSQMMARKMDVRNTPREELFKLREEVIQGMVDDRLLFVKAMRDSIDIDAREVDRELKNQINALKMKYSSEEAFQKGLDEYGLNEVQLRKMYGDAIAKDFLLQQIRYDITRLVSVSPQDLESWIAANRDSLPDIPDRYKFSHILIYPRVREERKAAAREKLQGILDRIKAGEDFAELAKEYSDDPGSADKGGYIGYIRRGEGYDEDFVNAAFALDEKEVSGIVETKLGFHIIKVEDILGESIEVRHILVHMVPDEQDEQYIAQKLEKIREDIIAGKATFEDMAKKYSEDENTKELGGTLDWLSGEQGMSDSGLPSFIEQGKKLKIGEISPPFKSRFGYHILKLDDFKPSHVLNIRDDRTLLEPLIKQQKFIEEYEKIIQDLRKNTYIDIRIN